jgi:hypothetical protein
MKFLTIKDHLAISQDWGMIKINLINAQTLQHRSLIKVQIVMKLPFRAISKGKKEK